MKKIFSFVICGSLLSFSLALNAMDGQEKGTLQQPSSKSSLGGFESSEFEDLGKQHEPAPAIQSSQFLRPSAISFKEQDKTWLNETTIPLKGKHFYSMATDEETEEIEIRVSIRKFSPVIKALLMQQQHEDFNPVPHKVPQDIKELLKLNNDKYYDLGYNKGYDDRCKEDSCLKKYGTNIVIGTTAFGVGAVTAYLLTRHSH